MKVEPLPTRLSMLVEHRHEDEAHPRLAASLPAFSLPLAQAALRHPFRLCATGSWHRDGQARERGRGQEPSGDPGEQPARRCGYLKAKSVEPFTQHHLAAVAGVPLGGHADIPSPRASFADWPRRRIQPSGWEGDWRTGRPVLTVYYLGGPDTTPEFTTGAALERFLASALAPRR